MTSTALISLWSVSLSPPAPTANPIRLGTLSPVTSRLWVLRSGDVQAECQKAHRGDQYRRARHPQQHLRQRPAVAQQAGQHDRDQHAARSLDAGRHHEGGAGSRCSGENGVSHALIPPLVSRGGPTLERARSSR